MTQYDVRQDKPYRRGLVLGLTMAEVMILLNFLLLMALGAALANRDKKLALYGNGGMSQLVEAVQRAFPKASTPDQYFKELKRAVDARDRLEAATDSKQATASLLEDARLGKAVREAAAKAGQKKTDRAAEDLIADAEVGRLAREAAAQRGETDPAKIAAALTKDAEIGRNARSAAAAMGEKDPEAFVKGALGKAKNGKKGEWPPFFSLSEAGGYYFDPGKATLRPEFERNLITSVIPMLRKNIDDYGVDVVEVIGHTDEVPMVGNSNLDRNLIAASASRFAIANLQSTDNAGLAIARAVSVVHILRADPRLAGVTILPLSGAQMIVPVDRPADGSATGSDKQRRRIEIRLRRSTEQQSTSPTAAVAPR